jgi:hypothetical protein
MKQPHISTIRRCDLSRRTDPSRELEDYCELHPRTPAAVRRPQLSMRRGMWVALLGPSLKDGIVGFGSNVSAALKAFDRNYLAALRPPRT